MKINFDEIWEKAIKQLEGTTILTLDYKKPNKILKVTETTLTRDTGNNSDSPPIPKDAFKSIYKQIMEKGTISRLEINNRYPKRFSSILCAVLAKCPNIGVELNPIRLFKK
ncbi:hypothetical protein MUB18_17070 [Sphingobacterium sp. PCS056]|uniref:hypothetical protein n=1 Tax=Sphingobacterium sp. PCS056 TaxID=2931400 RepID=UPI00201089F6|nr:hypothetical protein [Sphingobacterium sp. PCS056]UPZ35816.1 hypothetical protein MUB18_17070 [Sphingobacterium sp. PCS056]